jgi:hypothetical protein
MEEFIQPQEEDLTRTPIIIARGHSRPTHERNSNMVVLIQEAMMVGGKGKLLSFLDINRVVEETAFYGKVQRQVGTEEASNLPRYFTQYLADSAQVSHYTRERFDCNFIV